MSLTEEEKKQIVDYRLEKSKKTLNDAKKVIELKIWVTAANRLYMPLITQCRHYLYPTI